MTDRQRTRQTLPVAPAWPASARRITITVPKGTYQRLIERSDIEGRSLSNLAAFLLERALTHSQIT